MSGKYFLTIVSFMEQISIAAFDGVTYGVASFFLANSSSDFS